MMINVLSHPAVPLVLGSLLIFLIRSKSNLLSFISLTLSIIVLLFIMPHENAFYIEKGIQINAWADIGYEKNIRITVGTEEDNEACLVALKEALT